MAKDNDMKWVKIFAILGVFFLAMNVISYVWFPFLPWTEQRQAGEDVVESEMNAEQALQDYEEFRRLYFDIEAQREKLQNAYEEEEQFHETYGNDPDEWSRTAEERHGRIHTRITGHKDQLSNLVSDYNAKSATAHESIWKCHLPYKVDERFAIQGPPGSDAPETPNDTYKNVSDPNKEPPTAEECDGLPRRAES